ncbi:MAG: hypothetical protein HXL68_03795 [Dechloromonas agitata]|uniref:Cytochrome c domain-containing protein n=1 Tax=Dechloromonas agitata TaxID=73030 RepID=A0A930FYK4_9RHOO|nr:hypothetical protein [Dechloromonas agitata]
MAEIDKRFLAALALLITSSSHAAEPIPAASVVRFNTVCANCHEGECSGRLSFHTGAKEARGHMQRYLGSITDSEALNLFGLLRHTKEECAHYPLASPLRIDHQLGTSELAAWRNSREGGYFIPLGALGKGEYLLRLDFSAAGNGKMKLTDDRFEPLFEENLCTQQNALEFRFKAEGGPHFLTIKAPVVVDRLLLKAAPQP